MLTNHHEKAITPLPNTDGNRLLAVTEGCGQNAFFSASVLAVACAGDSEIGAEPKQVDHEMRDYLVYVDEDAAFLPMSNSLRASAYRLMPPTDWL